METEQNTSNDSFNNQASLILKKSTHILVDKYFFLKKKTQLFLTNFIDHVNI